MGSGEFTWTSSCTTRWLLRALVPWPTKCARLADEGIAVTSSPSQPLAIRYGTRSPRTAYVAGHSRAHAPTDSRSDHPAGISNATDRRSIRINPDLIRWMPSVKRRTLPCWSTDSRYTCSAASGASSVTSHTNSVAPKTDSGTASDAACHDSRPRTLARSGASTGRTSPVVQRVFTPVEAVKSTESARGVPENAVAAS